MHIEMRHFGHAVLRSLSACCLCFPVSSYVIPAARRRLPWRTYIGTYTHHIYVAYTYSIIHYGHVSRM
ncbi:hypothetical protein EON63_18900 [archaeon]|nr:MAG: hypothetical protein EON63_18900 [archaeon]